MVAQDEGSRLQSRRYWMSPWLCVEPAAQPCCTARCAGDKTKPTETCPVPALEQWLFDAAKADSEERAL